MKDVLSDIFETLRVQAAVYFRTDFTPPWAIEVPTYETAARFHLVVRGWCNVRLASGQGVLLQAGDLALVPHGKTHVLADAPDRAPISLDRALDESGYSGDGVFVHGKGDPSATSQMVCGHFRFSEGADHPLLRALPELVVLTKAERIQHPFLDDTIELLIRRVFTSGIGATAAVTKLSEVFLVETIRASASQSPDLMRVIGAMTDHHVGKALTLLHQEFAQDWTVESLSGAVGMSRSRFAERFTELVGMAPMKYLAEWRLQRAMFLLSMPRLTIQEIATRVGYNSSTAFSRAFAQRFGSPPTDFKRV